jgi:hypothetical protein
MNKAFLAAIAIVALGSSARAADICIGITSPSYTNQRCGTVPDAAIPLFFAAYAGTYGTVSVPGTPAVTNPDGSVTPATPDTTRPATRDEEFQAFASGMASGIANNLRSFAVQQAQAAAAAQVPVVTITPK